MFSLFVTENWQGKEEKRKQKWCPQTEKRYRKERRGRKEGAKRKERHKDKRTKISKFSL